MFASGREPLLSFPAPERVRDQIGEQPELIKRISSRAFPAVHQLP